MYRMKVRAELSEDTELRPDPKTYKTMDAAICALMDWSAQDFWPAKVDPQTLTVTIEKIT